jgi:RHS repeat-associated protein
MPSHDLRRALVALPLIYLFVVSLLSPLATVARSAPTIKLNRVKPEQANAPYRNGELLVRFRAGVSRQDKETIVAAYGARRKKELEGGSGVEKLELLVGQDARTVALQMLLDPRIDFVEPNFLIAKDDVTPNDARFNEQWDLRNTGQNGGQFGSDINAAGAWSITTGSRSTVIAVIDSGIDFTHPDLANNEWANPAPGARADLHGWDYVLNSAEIKDEQGHGTAVAGIIASEGNNFVGVSGVMWRGSLMSLRVLDNTGTGDIASAVEAIDYAVQHGAQVINLSWGTNGESLALKDALERGIRRGVVVVCSAGNGGRDLATGPYYPASFDLHNLITVAASDNFDRLTTWSNWGARSVSIAAPGTNILTTQMGGGYWNVTGTSAAAPLVTGIVGLLKTFRPLANAQIITRSILESARKTATLSGKVASGGVVNAEEALAQMRGSPNQSPAFPIPGNGGPGSGGSFSTTPPPTTTGPPALKLPNLDELRNAKPQTPKAKAPIESNLICADCDPYGGGGGATNYPSGDPNFSTARGRPINETGEPGVDLGSRNFNWSAPLLSLPGRAGLDLGLTLSYNSLVWTKDGSYMKFNADLGSPAPGFRLGLPTLQQRFFNSQTGIYAYMMVTPSGGRIELRQVGSSNIYESQDSTYTQLDVSNLNAPVVRTTDGTQLTFTPVTINSEYRCAQIKDRNGNYISATYNSSNGHLQTITDTLGRVVTFLYDNNNNLSAINQTWNGNTTHNWATFYYGEVYVAPAFGGGLLVNGPNGNNTTVLTQVNLPDGSYFTFNYNTAFAQVNRVNRYAPDGHLLSYTSYNTDSSSGQTECPRFTQRRDWAENWNSGNEAVTAYSVAGDGSWTQQTAPDQTIYKEFFAISGWQTGLTTGTEIWSGGVKKKWTTIGWTQDDTGLSYQKNPRVTETNIYDAEGNRRRTVIDYGQYGLPNVVHEYAADGTTEIRQTLTTYNLSQAYLDRRIIGLVSEVQRSNVSQTQEKISYTYDEPSRLQAVPAAATQHDTAYSTSLTARGNVTAVSRWDVSDINNQAKRLITYVNYYTTGTPISTTDPANHQSIVAYTDSFSDGSNRNTFAYPTTVTDPDGFQTITKYNFDFGGVSWTQTPSPNAAQTAPTQDFSYDSVGRIQQITNNVNNAHVRWVYSTSGTVVSTFSTIVSGLGEAFSGEVVDGGGRIIGTISDHPGSTGLYSAQLSTYDYMDRLVQQSNPTEVTAAWVPTGDDGAWFYTLQTYDWKGRPIQTTLPDGSTRENLYGGCGCAGGEVTTVRDERGRRRKLTMDVVGRLKQVDELNWDQSVYSTTTYTYNARDQITQINQAGQTRSFGYDGYGRLSTRTTPEQGTTTYSYLADDAVQTITDARNATTTFGYNNRHLVTSISYGVPATVAATPNVSFTYDAAGNRTSMTDGLGSVSYAYDQLSRLITETRTFTGLPPFALNYGYNLAGELTSITSPWSTVGYSYDKIGRPTSVTGSGYGGVSSYISGISYRTFGVKQINYSNSRTLSVQYDNRLRPTSWSIPGVLRLQYGYAWENSGRVEFVRNQDDETLDRYLAYDQVGRLIVTRSGNEARLAIGEQVPLLYNGPYSHGYQYDQWGNMTYREGWGGDNPSYTATYSNNKRAGLTYDAAGNVTDDGGQTFTYDATGQAASASSTLLQQYYDGDRLRVKKTENNIPTYYLRSSVLGGQVVAEINGTNGVWLRGYVYLGGELLAVQQDLSVSWIHQDPVAKSKRVTNSAGAVVSTIELDPWGGNTSRSNSDAFQPRKFTSYERDTNGSDEAMFRRYNRWWSRFDQPDPYEGSYDLTDPQSFNRYAYVQNDPVNHVDPTGFLPMMCGLFMQYINGDPIGEGYICFGESFPFGGFFGGGGGGGDTDGTEPPQNPRQEKAEQLVNDCRVRAMLDALAWAEGTADDPNSGYGTVAYGTVTNSRHNPPELRGRRNVTISDFSHHPGIRVRFRQTRPNVTSAAGRYQFLEGTWNGLGLADFSPSNQDLGAVMLLQEAGAIEPLLAGNVRQAAYNARRQWASLPGSPYGQPTRRANDFQGVYNDALTKCQQK